MMRTPVGRFFAIGRSRTFAMMSPSGCPLSSAETVTLRSRFRRSMRAGPLPSVISATADSGTGPRAPGTRSWLSTAGSVNAPPASCTRIGT